MFRLRYARLLVLGALASTAAGEPGGLSAPLATIDVQVLKQGAAENQGIQLSAGKVSVGTGDNIRILVDSGVFCPGGGATSGTVTAAVPVNACGFTPGNSTITEGGALQTTLGPANGGVTNFNITLTYSDTDCGLNDGPAVQTLAVNCNGVDKGCCAVLSPPGTQVEFIRGITEADCMAQAGVLAWDNAVCVPTVSTWGVAVMTLLVLSAATIVIMRRRAAAA